MIVISLILPQLLGIYIARVFDVCLGMSWTSSISAAVGSVMGVGAGLAVAPAMIATGLVIGLLVIPALKLIGNQKPKPKVQCTRYNNRHNN